MLTVTVKLENRFDRIAKAANKAAFRNFAHAAAAIRRDAAASIVRAEGSSPPGAAPHTHRGAWLRRAIRFDATKDGAVIGPRASMVGQVGAAHEFGGRYKGQQFPERPFMGPALDRNRDRFASDWAGSIGE